MTREEIIRALRVCASNNCDGCPVLERYSDVLDACSKMSLEAADLLEAQGREEPSPSASLTPPPEEEARPLTLEELRQMDGEPVWVTSAIREQPEWYIVDTGRLELINPWAGIALICYQDSDFPYRAYRRKPEGGQENEK